jgi:hypothetical protein
MAGTHGYHTPFMGSVTVTTVPQSLYTLLQAIWADLPIRACFLQIQLDTTAGGTSLYIGNSNVAANMCGANLNANQANVQYAFDRNLLVLNDLWMVCSAATVQVNLIVVNA